MPWPFAPFHENREYDSARELMAPYPPSSPSIAILKDGKLVYMMERGDIEMSGAEAIAAQLKAAFAEHCA